MPHSTTGQPRLVGLLHVLPLEELDAEDGGGDDPPALLLLPELEVLAALDAAELPLLIPWLL